MSRRTLRLHAAGAADVSAERHDVSAADVLSTSGLYAGSGRRRWALSLDGTRYCWQAFDFVTALMSRRDRGDRLAVLHTTDPDDASEHPGDNLESAVAARNVHQLPVHVVVQDWQPGTSFTDTVCPNCDCLVVGQQEHVLDATLKDCSSDILIVSAPIRSQRRRSPRAHSRRRRRQVKPREQHPRFKPGEDALPPKAAPYTWVVRRAPLCRRRRNDRRLTSRCVAGCHGQLRVRPARARHSTRAHGARPPTRRQRLAPF